MKRFFVLFMVMMVSAFILIGCGSQEAEPVMSEPVEETVEEAVEETPEIEEEAEIATNTLTTDDTISGFDCAGEDVKLDPDEEYIDPEHALDISQKEAELKQRLEAGEITQEEYDAEMFALDSLQSNDYDDLYAEYAELARQNAEEKFANGEITQREYNFKIWCLDNPDVPINQSPYFSGNSNNTSTPSSSSNADEPYIDSFGNLVTPTPSAGGPIPDAVIQHIPGGEGVKIQ